MIDEHECAESYRACMESRKARIEQVKADLTVVLERKPTPTELAEEAEVSVSTAKNYLRENHGVSIPPKNIVDYNPATDVIDERCEVLEKEPTSAQFASWVDQFLAWPFHVQKQAMAVISQHYEKRRQVK